MRFFLAGIMQGSHAEALLHDQDYRARITRLIEAPFSARRRLRSAGRITPSRWATTTPPAASVFFRHNRMCREIDVLLAFVPEASMGTAIEMWEAYQHGAAVITISPLKHNWAVKFLSHAVYTDLEQFEAAMQSGDLAERIDEVRRKG